MRLNAWLARAGVASRRKADELIKDGRVSVNGEPGQLNTFVQRTDDVRLDGKPLSKQELSYVLLHKPAGVVTTASDPQGRTTVVDLVELPTRVVPVGRLDADTTGALLLTNDGDLAHQLAHPKYEIDKVYVVQLWKQPSDGTLRKLAEGVNLDDGKTSPAEVRRLAGSTIELTIHEGRNRQVKRMFEAVGYRVKALHRARYAGLNVDYALSPEAKFPQALLECAEVVRCVAETADDWDIDASRIVVGGDSAGGNLAIGTAIALRDQGGPALAGMHLAYPVADANFDTNSYRAFAEGHGLTRVAMQTYWDLYTRDAADRLNPLAAPLRDHCRGLPPALVQVAELDVLRSEGEMLAHKINLVGGRAALISYPGVLHGFLRLGEAVGQAREAVAHAGEWMKEVGGLLEEPSIKRGSYQAP